jgi:hypothetical protein
MTRRCMHSRFVLLIGLVVAMALGLRTTAAGQSAEGDQRWILWKNGVGIRWLMYHLEKSEAEFLKAKWDAIGHIDGARFEGDYIVPAYMSGYFLRWSKEKGYVFVRYFDVEHPCYFTFGDVKVTEASVQFIQKGSASRSVCPSSDDGAPADEWVFAVDGRFLIPRSRLRDFADYYCGFGEYNGSNRRLESLIPYAIRPGPGPKGTPTFVFPTEFSKFIKSPLTGQITSVGKTLKRKSKIFSFGTDYETVTPVTIDVGRDRGLRRKQEFVLLTEDDDYSSETLIVESVGKFRSRGIVVRKIDENGKVGFSVWNEGKSEFETKEFKKLRPGIRVTTSPIAKL